MVVVSTGEFYFWSVIRSFLYFLQHFSHFKNSKFILAPTEESLRPLLCFMQKGLPYIWKEFFPTFFNFVIFTIFTWFLLPKRQRKSCAQQKCEIVKRPLHLCRTSHFRQNFVKIFPLLLLAIFRENQVEFVKSVLLQNCSVSLAQRVCKIWYNSPSWLSRNFHKTGKKPNFFRLSAEAAVF